MANYIKDILNMDYNTIIQLTKKENFDQFKTILTRMGKTANRRIKTLKSTDIGQFSPAYQNLKDAGITKFDISKIEKATSSDTGKLLHEYSVMKKFLESKTSRLSGWNAVRSGIRKRIKSKNLFKKEFRSKRQATYWINREKKFWKMYNKLVDEYGGIISQLDSDKIQKMLNKIQSLRNIGKSDDVVQDAMETYIDELYKAKQKGYKLNDDAFVDEVKIKYV